MVIFHSLPRGPKFVALGTDSTNERSLTTRVSGRVSAVNLERGTAPGALAVERGPHHSMAAGTG